MSQIVLVYTLFGDADSARGICRTLVEERLAACANILAGAVSVYEWNGAIQEEGEVPVILKTRAELRDQLIERLTTLHPYEVPAILSWPADTVHPRYADWLFDRTVS